MHVSPTRAQVLSPVASSGLLSQQLSACPRPVFTPDQVLITSSHVLTHGQPTALSLMLQLHLCNIYAISFQPLEGFFFSSSTSIFLWYGKCLVLCMFQDLWAHC